MEAEADLPQSPHSPHLAGATLSTGGRGPSGSHSPLAGDGRRRQEMALSVGSDQPRPPADSSGSQLCPSSAPGPALEGGDMHSSWLKQRTGCKGKHPAREVRLAS